MHSSPSISQRFTITTANNDTADLIERAKRLALETNGLYIPRRDLPIHVLFKESHAERILVVRSDRFILLDLSGAEYQFHPNLAIVRASNYLSHGSDHFLEAVQLQRGERVLDCTLGFGSEALLAAMVVGAEGEVVGLESVPELAVITREGMRSYRLQQKKLEAVMRRVVVLNFDYRDYLRLAPTHSADLVYFDPFFGNSLEKSANSVGPLAAFGNRAPLDINSIVEARRVSRRIVAIKHLKWHKLPKQIASEVAEVICGRRSTIAYSIITAHGVSELCRRSSMEALEQGG